MKMGQNKDNLKYEDDLKNDEHVNMKMTSKIKMT